MAKVGNETVQMYQYCLLNYLFIFSIFMIAWDYFKDKIKIWGEWILWNHFQNISAEYYI